MRRLLLVKHKKFACIVTHMAKALTQRSTQGSDFCPDQFQGQPNLGFLCLDVFQGKTQIFPIFVRIVPGRIFKKPKFRPDHDQGSVYRGP